MTRLLAIEEARARVLAAGEPARTEDVPVERALGRVLAADVTADMAVPPFDSSAMDGFALVAGPASELPVVGESRAGHPFAARLEPGTAVRISTGAVVPEGADAVVPVERTEAAGERVRVPDTEPGANVRYTGEDVRAGEVVIPAATRLGPAELGVAASLGHAALRCALRPRVALVVTGDELARPGEPLGHGRIYSSNAYALRRPGRAGRRGAGGLGHRARYAPRAPARRSSGRSPAPIWSACPAACRSGRTTTCGRRWLIWAWPSGSGGSGCARASPRGSGSATACSAFGLPGNPVSAMVTFQLFVRPAIAALQGADPAARLVTAALGEEVACHPQREQAVRVRLSTDDGLRAFPTGPQGSHQLTSMLGRGRPGADPHGRRQACRRRPRAGGAPVRRRDPRRLLERERRARARVQIVRVPRSEYAADGSIGSKQVAEVSLPREELDRVWSAEYLERLAATYWRFLTRFSLGLLRVVYTDSSREVVLLRRPFVLLRFRKPEYEISSDWRDGDLADREGAAGGALGSRPWLPAPDRRAPAGDARTPSRPRRRSRPRW